MSLVGRVRGAATGGLAWDLSGTIGAQETDLFITDTVNASLGPESPTGSTSAATGRRRSTSTSACRTRPPTW